MPPGGQAAGRRVLAAGLKSRRIDFEDRLQEPLFCQLMYRYRYILSACLRAATAWSRAILKIVPTAA